LTSARYDVDSDGEQLDVHAKGWCQLLRHRCSGHRADHEYQGCNMVRKSSRPGNHGGGNLSLRSLEYDIKR
jgi:hypothetical protein